MTEKVLNFFILLPVVWLTTGLFWFSKGASYMGGVCLVAAILVVGKYRFKTLLVNINDGKILWILFFCFLCACMAYMSYGYSSRELKALFFSFVFLLFFPKEKLNDCILEMVVVLGALGVFVTAGYQYFFMDVSRIHGFINPITYATFSAFCFVTLFLSGLSQENKILQSLSFMLSALVFVAIILTGARGVLLAVILTLIILAFFGVRSVLRVRRSFVVVSLVILIVSLITIYPAIDERIEATKLEISSIYGGSYDSSIGLRLQMWRSAYYSSSKSPLLGLGDAYIEDIAEQYDKGVISKSLYDHNVPHYHNQYIDKFIKNGLLGLMLLLLLLGYPLYIAIKSRGHSIYKLNIIGIVSVVMISGFSDVPLNHAPILYYYVIMVSCQLYRLKCQSNNSHAVL